MLKDDHSLLEETTLAILKSLPFGVYYCDRSLTVRYINAPYAQYIGLPPQEIIGKKITEFIPSSRAKEVMENDRDELYQEASLLSEKNNQRILVNRIPVRTPQGEVTGFISQLISVGDQGWKSIWRKMEYAERMLREISPATTLLEEAHSPENGIISASPLIQQCIEKALAYAKTNEPILITGPTGVGKELFARAIQQCSLRAQKPFICVNCASISKEFVNSELFGYAPGAFTGAHRHGKAGLMELAHGGTLFLDEIGDLPLEAQGVLLRVLETLQVQRINAVEAKHVDFRLISATNKDLWDMCCARQFREDLFFRLSALPLHIPTLAERKGDIPLLVRHFLSKIQGAHLGMDDATIELLQKYSWPGNIRELRNALTYAAITAQGATIRKEHLPLAILNPHLNGSTSNDERATLASPLPQNTSLENAEQEAIIAALQHCGNNLTRSARILGISRTTLYAKLRKYRIPRKASF